jgi:membrane-associated protease RseP (regulator of RpoE activity)
MQSEKEHIYDKTGANDFQTHTCPSCHATMVSGMRFCRLCGYRLGEGVEEYAETRRFNTEAPPVTRNTTPTFGIPADFGAMSPHASSQPATLNRPSSRFRVLQSFCNMRRSKWMLWTVIGIAIFVATGGGLQSLVDSDEGGSSAPTAATRSYIGADIEDGANGVLIESVMPPGSPADRAGLVGGDVVTTFDGTQVTSERELLDALGATPVGKTVDLRFVRDGAEKTTKLTTVSVEDRKRLAETFAERPEGEGFLGIEPGELQPVPVESLKIQGVRLGEVIRNRPGYIAGLRDGDIVVEFEGVPIRTEKEFLARINRAIPDSVVRLVVMRDGNRIEIPVKMGQD